MNASHAQPATIAVDERHHVSALTIVPATAYTCFVFAHGAGAGMTHPFMESMSHALSAVGVATLRFQFPYMERRSRRTDPPALCHATVRAAVNHAARTVPGLPLIAGGRSFGGRMASQAHAISPLPLVRGIAFLGFPLHPAGKPSTERATHLFETDVPLLFLQGDRDELAELNLLKPIVERLGARATLTLIEAADHSYKVPARSGRKGAQVQLELVQALRDWIETLRTL